MYDCFAVAAPGIAELVAQELRDLTIPPVTVEPDGVSFHASPVQLFTANLWLRTASRVLVRAGSFPAKAFHELERRAAHVEWARFLTRDSRVTIRATCRKSKLYHSDAVAERVLRVITAKTGAQAAGDDESGTQLVVVRLQRDICSISIDASGEHLHRRGYRQATAKAPMRETLAAALLLASGWDRRSPLLDPMCGAGTIAIEAACMATHRAPGLDRVFVCERWPEAPVGEYDAVRAQAAASWGPPTGDPLCIIASDRDAGAIAATEANAGRAGISSVIRTAVQPISAIAPPTDVRGWLVTNPPYGIRVGQREPLRNLYAQLGAVLRERCVGWTVALLSPDRRLSGHTGLSLTRRFRTTNGGIPVEALVGPIPK